MRLGWMYKDGFGWRAVLLGGTGFCVLLAFAFALLGAAFAPAVQGASPQPMPEGAAYAQLEAQDLDTRFILVLDAGHGGYDPGAVDATGTVYESEVNQAMVDRVTELLQAHAGELEVVQAHTPGSYAAPMARTNTAVRLQADLFLSLHLNADERASTRGFQCFPTPPGRVHHQQSVRFAQLLVEQVAASNALVLGTSGIYYTYYVRTATGYHRDVLDAAVVDTQDPRRDESYGVVEYAGCPSVLAELWHISSPEDMALYATEAGMAQMAQCLYLAVCDYFGLQPVHGVAVP